MENKEIEDIALYYQKKRKKHRIKLTILSTILLGIAIILLATYYIFSKGEKIKFKENSHISYGVNLKENEFYNKTYLEEGIDIISDLINNINIEFKYNLDLQQEIEYRYSYKILAEIKVKEKSKTNLIYQSEQEIFRKEEQQGKNKKLAIIENLTLDYNAYDNLIKNLLQQYKLENTTSELSLNLYLNVVNKTTGERINKENKVMTIMMPLNAKTVEITKNEYIKDNEDFVVIQKNKYAEFKNHLIIGIVILLLGLIVLITLIRYNLKTRSAEKIYDDELKKILFDYKSYIQKINSKVDYKDYKIIKIDTFKELLGIREDVQSPILMYTEDENKTVFMIMNENILYAYILSSKLIRENLIKESKKKEEKKNEQNK